MLPKSYILDWFSRSSTIASHKQSSNIGAYGGLELTGKDDPGAQINAFKGLSAGTRTLLKGTRVQMIQSKDVNKFTPLTLSPEICSKLAAILVSMGI